MPGRSPTAGRQSISANEDRNPIPRAPSIAEFAERALLLNGLASAISRPMHTGSIKSLCVFCGSSPGNRTIFQNAAEELGEFLARSNVTLVYGGASVGLMGILADSVLAAGGKAIGVMPKSLIDLEIAHQGLHEFHNVDTMHQRKEKMAALADAFVALPGGAGTLEELFEQWTWFQLGMHGKPCGVLNVGGYFDPLANMIESMSENGFLQERYLKAITISSSVSELFDSLAVAAIGDRD